MQVVILCGGRGSRLGEDTRLIPKPMIEIENANRMAYNENFRSTGF